MSNEDRIAAVDVQVMPDAARAYGERGSPAAYDQGMAAVQRATDLQVRKSLGRGAGGAE